MFIRRNTVDYLYEVLRVIKIIATEKRMPETWGRKEWGITV